ncbi:MAG TPA: ATP-binding protein [Spongiibacteraceae bacterium]|nr:ATP-binding protein [Spongiibacteraceae bacterium]
MNTPRNSWKLTPLIALSSAAALLLIGLGIMFYGGHLYKTEKINEVSVQARILAATVTAALDFKDREAAEEYASALQSNGEVLAVGIFDARGKLFASYARNGRTLPASVQDRPAYFDGDVLISSAPVSLHGLPLGTVYVQTQTEPGGRRLARYAVITLLVTMTALIVGVLGVSQSALRKANKELAQRALDLASANDNLHQQIAEREKAEAALRQAQKMEAIGQLTGGVAHDFNNLLQVILGNLDALLAIPAIRNNEEFSSLIEMSVKGAERGASLTRQLLAFGRRQALAAKPFGVNKLVLEMSDLLHRTLGEKIEIVTKLAPELWHAAADPHQLENALLNLAVNARDAMPAGGCLSIETGNAYLDAAHNSTENSRSAGEYVCIAVTDTGFGMNEEVLSKAFEPFFTTKEVGAGSGLGLSQIYGYVKQSGGDVKIRSAPGQGTTITIYLPRSADQQVEAPVEIQQMPAMPDTETILVVEDEKIVLLTAVQSLKGVGYNVLQADSATTALDILKSEQTIDILFTDVVMPGQLNGVELAVEALRLRPNIKVLLASGYTRSALTDQHGLSEDVPILQKPYRTQELAKQLRLIMRAA